MFNYYDPRMAMQPMIRYRSGYDGHRPGYDPRMAMQPMIRYRSGYDGHQPGMSYRNGNGGDNFLYNNMQEESPAMLSGKLEIHLRNMIEKLGVDETKNHLQTLKEKLDLHEWQLTTVCIIEYLLFSLSLIISSTNNYILL